MPHDAQGRPFEYLANPLGIISRTNPSQAIEASLGKISERTGQPYRIDDFTGINDLTAYAQEELKKHGLSDTETITDPATGKAIPNVFTGNRYIMKLHHMSESKGQGRGLGAYTSEDQPARGGGEGGQSKKVALMNVNALLSHGATSVLRDIKMVRGQKNQEYWSRFMSGHAPPTPGVPFVYRKFVEQLRGAGVNVVRDGPRMNVMALTDKDIDELAGDREIRNAETVDWQTGLQPIPGGLFDINLTGSHGGSRWSHIRLHEPLPSPVMEEPIRRVLNLTKNGFEEVLAGRKPLDGQSGPLAISSALGKINLPQAIAQAREDVKSKRGASRDAAIKTLGFLVGAEKAGIHPKDWVLSKVPVLPPAFRPVSAMQGKSGQLVNDMNYLYKEVFDANQSLKELSAATDDVGEERLNLYRSIKAVTGLGDPTQPKNQERGVKGLLEQVFGTSPKYGTLQAKLLGTPVDLVGRAVVVPNPDLDMDHAGLPEAKAWSVYNPFIIRRLIRRGVPKLQALAYAKDRHPLARKALLEEMDARPIIIDRAPVLHRYGMMAFYPKLVKGDVLQMPPLIVAGFGLDFDGDQMNYSTPASDEAVTEAVEKMLPSKNLFATNTFNKPNYQPRQEFLSGLHTATSSTNMKKPPRVFATKQDALNAYWRGQVDADQRIEIVGEH